METGAQASVYGGIQRFDKREHLAQINAARKDRPLKDEKTTKGCEKAKPCWLCGDLLRCTLAAAEERAKKPTERQSASRATASKVCGIANRIPRDVPRKEAFAAAWSIVRNGGIEIALAGVSFGSRQEAIAKLATYDPKDVIALLVPEPDCKHDPDAIAVKVMVNGGKGIYTLGYVPRADAKVARAFLGAVPELRLVGGETKGARIRLAA